MATKDKGVQVLVRVSAVQRDRYKLAAAAEGFTLSEFIRRLADVRSAEVLDCTHPVGLREKYPWSETCTKCGVRVREGDVWLIPDVLR
jgi:hypothetical protein